MKTEGAVELQLWNGEKVTRTISLDFKPLAIRAWRGGLLLIRRQPWTQMTEYLRQNVPMHAVTANIVYLDTNTLQQTFLTTCAFPY